MPEDKARVSACGHAQAGNRVASEDSRRGRSAVILPREPSVARMGFFNGPAEHLYSNGRDPPNVAASRR